MGTNTQSYPTSQFGHTPDLSKSKPLSRGQKTYATIFRRELHIRPSLLAMVISERSFQFSLQGRLQSEATAKTRTFLSSLFWVMRWVLRFAFGGVHSEQPYRTQEPRPLSRTQVRLVKRLGARAGRVVSICPPYLFELLCRGLSYTQRCEVLVQFSLMGRVRVYGIRFRAKCA